MVGNSITCLCEFNDDFMDMFVICTTKLIKTVSTLDYISCVNTRSLRLVS
jgi:hypothetical protein